MDEIDDAQETGSRSSVNSGRKSGASRLESLRLDPIKENDPSMTGAVSSCDTGPKTADIPPGIVPDTRPVFEGAVEDTRVNRQPKDPSALVV